MATYSRPAITGAGKTEAELDDLPLLANIIAFPMFFTGSGGGNSAAMTPGKPHGTYPYVQSSLRYVLLAIRVADWNVAPSRARRNVQFVAPRTLAPEDLPEHAH
jgi:hypothetical protein